MQALTPELLTTEDAIIESVRRGVSLTAAADANGISHETVRWWQKIADGAETWQTGAPVSEEKKASIKRFMQRVAQARGECRTVLVSSLYHNATTQNAKTGWYDTQAADKILSKSSDHRGDWHEERHTTITQQGQVSHEHTLVQQLAQQGGVEALEQLERELDALPSGDTSPSSL